jgi:hypothetical protein
MNKREEILEFIEDGEIKLFDESKDEALIGYVERAGDSSFVLYDKDKIFELFKYEPLWYEERHLYFTKATLKEIEKIDEGEVLIADGFDDAIIGYAHGKEGINFVIYNTEKCIEILSKDFAEEMRIQEPEKTEDKIEEETNTMALEYFYYNTVGAYMGKRTPGFATLFSE